MPKKMKRKTVKFGGFQWYQTAQSYFNQYSENQAGNGDAELQYSQANDAYIEAFEIEESIALGLCNGDDEETAELCEAFAERGSNEGYSNYWINSLNAALLYPGTSDQA
jgi:lysylphosphatidylglycerol synthetase-like protein (DUF2156 family)